MLTKRRRQRKQQKKTIGLINPPKKFCTCSTLFCTFLCRCFARRQRETSRNFLLTRFMREMLYVVLFSFFSLPLIFTSVAAGISHFLTAAIKFSRYSLNEIGLLCFFFISGSSSSSVIHANADFKIKSKERISFVFLVFYL